MPRFNTIQNSFLSGEISPRSYGRTDLPIHHHGLEEAYNFIVYPQGGGARRPGSQFFLSKYMQRRFVPSISTYVEADMPDDYRVIPFIVSKTEAYLVFLSTATGFTNAASQPFICMIYDLYTGLWDGQEVTTDASLHGHMKRFVWPTAQQLNEIQYNQSGDVMFFSHPELPPFYIKREPTLLPYWDADGNLLGTIYRSFNAGMFYENKRYVYAAASSNFIKNWPFMDMNVDTGVGMRSSNPTTDNVVGDTITVIANQSIFNAGHVNTLFRVTTNNSTGTGIFAVQSVTSATEVVGYVLKTFDNSFFGASYHYQFEEAAWSDYRGWPRSMCFYEGRMVWGGNKFQPDTIWGSQSYDIFEIAHNRVIGDTISFPSGATDAQKTTITNQQPFAFTLSSQEPNQIQWLSPGKSLAIGTHGREFVSSSENAIGPLNPSFSPETAHGSAFVQPVRVQNSVVFAQRSGQRVRELTYNWQENAYTSEDLTFYAEHTIKKALLRRETFTPPEIVQIAHQEADNQITWFLDSNGGLCGMTRDRNREVTAWHYHELGGNLSGEIPRVTSICVAPSTDGTHDDLYLVVKRTINGQQKTYVEKIGKEFQLEKVYNSSTNPAHKLMYSDCSILRIFGSPTLTCDGLDHLEGETVQVVADGSFIGSYTVESGAITVSTEASEFIVGLAYTTRLKTVNFDGGAVTTSAQGTIKRIDQVTIRFNRTIGAKFGYDESKLESIPMRAGSLAPGTPTPLFTGDKVLKFPGDYTRYAQVMVVQEDPMPMGVTCVVARGVTYD